MRLSATIAAALSVLVAGGCAAVPDDRGTGPLAVSSDRQCFSARLVNDYGEAPDGPGGRDRLYVRTGVKDRWLLETFAGCPNLDWSHRIALDTRTMTTLCTGDTAELLVPSGISGGGIDRCTVRVLGKIVDPR